MNLVCWGDGDIPAFLEIADGNQSDKARFAEIIAQFRQQWDFEGLYVADSALYSASNLQTLGNLRWVSRVPLTLSQASALLSEIDEQAFEASPIAGYRIAQVCCRYGEVRQRWLVVESAARKAADLKQLEKRIAKATQQTQAQLAPLSAQSFACQADAQQALVRFEQSLQSHQITQSTMVEQPHYDQPGRPAKNATPSRITYHIQASLDLLPEWVTQQQQRAGRFILATNVLASPQWDIVEFASESCRLTADDILSEYKAQQGTERGFRFLKDPLFFASSVFLKSPERIMALAMIMGLCLLVYNLAQRQLRNALQSANEAIPNQLGKLTDTPTLRWVFQSFMAIHWVSIEGNPQIVNLNDIHRKILKFLGSASQEYYLLS
jgi:transposase